MDLDKLLARIQEIDKAIVNMTNQLNALYGHKAETDYWISRIKASSDDVDNVEKSDEPVVE